MGLRVVRTVNDPILTKKAREVKEVNDRILSLLDDLVETMQSENGIGLAAPQVGVLRRVFVADVGDGNVYKMINPEIIEQEGEDIDLEGCLSIPNFRGTVKRATKVKMKYMDVNGEEQVLEADGILARCLQHERDHLDGILITSKYIEEVTEDELEEWLEERDKEKLEEEKENNKDDYKEEVDEEDAIDRMRMIDTDENEQSGKESNIDE